MLSRPPTVPTRTRTHTIPTLTHSPHPLMLHTHMKYTQPPHTQDSHTQDTVTPPHNSHAHTIYADAGTHIWRPHTFSFLSPGFSRHPSKMLHASPKGYRVLSGTREFECLNDYKEYIGYCESYKKSSEVFLFFHSRVFLITH